MNLQDLTYINTTAGRPSPNMTNEKWQELFKLLKLIIESSNQKSIITLKSHTNTDSRLGIKTYHGDTLDQTWRKILNDNIKQIRMGKHDYVYYIYNIIELLKYEHERLRSSYNQNGQYFEIWLDS